MKANELRIGNLVNKENHVCKVTTVSEKFIQAEVIIKDSEKISSGRISPIPLTEEWLVKFGFEKIDKLFYQKQVGDCSKLLIGYKTGPSGCFGAVTLESDLAESYIGHLSGYCKTVHQLQNLYFALTGQELKPNEI